MGIILKKKKESKKYFIGKSMENKSIYENFVLRFLMFYMWVGPPVPST